MTDPGCLGHRSRLLERFDKHGLESLNDYEIVELLLTFVIPRRDTKPLAKQLMARFGSINGLIHADKSELEKQVIITRRAGLLFALLRDVMACCLKERCEKKNAVAHSRDVEEYLRFTFGHKRDEYVAVLFLDNGNNVITSEIVHEGTVNQCAVYPRDIIGLALKHKAARLILAHNHPGGGAVPSEADWAITERLSKIGGLIDIPLVDHVIVAGDGVVSLRDMPRWKSLAQEGRL
jgi:DNA repair protein RadC